MKVHFITIVFTMLIINAVAQVPQGISHQAVIRDANNALVIEQQIGIQVSIIKGAPEGIVVYVETHTPSSNLNGLISFVIGQGAVLSGDFTGIDWAATPYFIKTEADPEGGTNYSITGTSQILSVPYALHSQKASTLEAGTTPGELLYWNGEEWMAIPPGQHDDVLRLCNGIPLWGHCLFTLNLIANPSGGGLLTGAGQYSEGTLVDINVIANPEFFFLNWVDEDSIEVSYQQNFQYSMPGMHSTFIANFIEISSGDGQRCPETPTVSDIDGNIYNTIHIGNQCWMRENLKTTKFNNGIPIAYPGSDNLSWQTNTTGAYAWYENDINWKDHYGALYTWYAVNNVQGLCPEGWHIPTDVEITELTDYLGGDNVAGSKMKSTRTDPSPPPRWNNPNTNATNESNFSAFPAGSRDANGFFGSIGQNGFWWSSTESGNHAWYRSLSTNSGSVNKNTTAKNVGVSVRCIKNSLPAVNTTPAINITATSATVGGITHGGGLTDRGIYWHLQADPQSNGTQLSFGTGDGLFSMELTGLINQTSYYYVAYATNSIDTVYGGQEEFTTSEFVCGVSIINDIDGNSYNTVPIGSQCYMKENLKTTTFRNGSAIVNVTNNVQWYSTNSSAYVWYQNDIGYKNIYGALYNQYAVASSNGLCPYGWHVPYSVHWSQLADFIGGTDAPYGNQLKSCRQVDSPLGGACNTTEHPRWVFNATHFGTDDFNLSVLPGGFRSGYTSSFSSIGNTAYFWSTPFESLPNAVKFYSHSGNIDILNLTEPRHGLSVRCLWNNAIQ